MWLRMMIAVALVSLGLAADAGEVFEKGGVAIRGYDPVAYFKAQRPVLGSAQFQAEYQGATFRFASQANRDDFVADPARYAPQYGGFCAYGMTNGYKATTDPAAFRIVDGRLYLNYNREVQERWATDVPGYIVKADGHWPTTKALTKVIE